MKDREAHLAWAKQRALDDLAKRGPYGALAMFGSLLAMHPAFDAAYFAEGFSRGIRLAVDDKNSVRDWIEAHE